ncbi:hypothetical protein [Maricaulis sp. CAU 1757]
MVERREAAAVLNTAVAELIDLRVHAFTRSAAIGSDDIESQIRSQLPDGWQVEVAEGFAFNALGYCTGGQIALIQPNGTRRTQSFAAGNCSQVQSAIARNQAGFGIEARPPDAG